MISVKVRSFWQGKVGIRDKYVKRALQGNESLEILYKNEGVMIIPAEKVQEKIVAKSEKPFQDKFGDKWHFLYYFNWKPLVNQQKLL